MLSFRLKILWWKKHWETKFRQWCQFRMITSGKSHSFILGSMWQLSISWNCENNNLLPFLELQQITRNCYCIFCPLSLVIVVFHLSAFMRFFSLFLLMVFRTSLLLCWKVIFFVCKTDGGNLKVVRSKKSLSATDGCGGHCRFDLTCKRWGLPGESENIYFKRI